MLADKSVCLIRQRKFFWQYCEKNDIYNITTELTIIQKTYDCIQWYVPILTRLPKAHKFTLGERMINGLYTLFDGLIATKYRQKKLPHLYELNIQLEVLRHQTRMLFDFRLMSPDRYEYASALLHVIGLELGGWIKQQQGKSLL